MHNDDTLLISAYLDGEMSEQDRYNLEQRLASDPEFAELYEEYERNNQALKASFADIASDPVPAALADLLDLNQTSNDLANPPMSNDESSAIHAAEKQSGSNVIDRSSTGWWTSRPVQMAAAVSFFTIGLSLIWFSADNPMAPQNLTAAIASHLDSTPSGQPQALDSQNQASMNILLSFEHNDGRLCREYTVRAQQQASFAIACRSESGWQTEVEHVIEGGTVILPSDNKYQPANAADIAELSQYVDVNAKSDPLSQTQELNHLENGWIK